MGKFRKLFFVAAALASVVAASFQPAHAGAQRAFCLSKGGTSSVSPKGMAECWVNGVNIYAIK